MIQPYLKQSESILITTLEELMVVYNSMVDDSSRSGRIEVTKDICEVLNGLINIQMISGVQFNLDIDDILEGDENS